MSSLLSLLSSSSFYLLEVRTVVKNNYETEIKVVALAYTATAFI